MQPLLFVLAIAFAHVTPAQTATPTGLYRIAGTVVSSTDGHPLAGATINLRQQDTTGKPLTSTTTSTEDGRFEFTGLPAGNFTLQGDVRNSLPTYYDEHDGFTTGIITGSTVATDALVLKLVPKCSLSGIITNEAGEPVANASVRLFRQSHSFGDDRIVPASTQVTDDLGHFEFRSLTPADYLVAVTALPWYAVHPQPSLIEQIQFQPSLPPNATQQQQDLMRQTLANVRRQVFFGITGPLDPSLDVAYPITYYPHGDDPTEAQPIPLRPGDSREISLQLSPVPAVTITIPHAAPPPRPDLDPQSPEFQVAAAQAAQAVARQIPQLRTSIFGNIEPAPSQQSQSTPTATTFSGLPPGDYLLTTGNTPVNQPSGATPIHLSNSDRSTTAALPDSSSLAHIHITLQTAAGAAPPANLSIGLLRAGAPTSDLITHNAAPKGDTDLNVPPGDYAFVIQPNKAGAMNARTPRSWFLHAITVNGKQLTANSIHLAAGDSPSITLTVIPGDHTLRGFVIHAANAASPSPESPATSPQPAPGAFLLLIPADELNTQPRSFWRQQSDLDGSFSISGLAPGNYILFAIDDGWTLDWQQPHALDRYLPAAAQITIPDNAPPNVLLAHPILAQPK